MCKKIFSVIYNKNYKTWSANQDKLLIEQVLLYGVKRNKWHKISSALGKSAKDCIKRFKKINPKIKKGKWTDEEDIEVVHLSKLYGKNWAKIAKNFSNKNRTGKQIRQRYLNFLDPSIDRSKFTLEEDIKIMQLHQAYKTYWKFYVKHFQHRSADMIKGRYYSSVRYNVKLLSVINTLQENKNVSNRNTYKNTSDAFNDFDIQKLKLEIQNDFMLKKNKKQDIHNILIQKNGEKNKLIFNNQPYKDINFNRFSLDSTPKNEMNDVTNKTLLYEDLELNSYKTMDIKEKIKKFGGIFKTQIKLQEEDQDNNSEDIFVRGNRKKFISHTIKNCSIASNDYSNNILNNINYQVYNDKNIPFKENSKIQICINKKNKKLDLNGENNFATSNGDKVVNFHLSINNEVKSNLGSFDKISQINSFDDSSSLKWSNTYDEENDLIINSNLEHMSQSIFYGTNEVSEYDFNKTILSSSMNHDKERDIDQKMNMTNLSLYDSKGKFWKNEGSPETFSNDIFKSIPTCVQTLLPTNQCSDPSSEFIHGEDNFNIFADEPINEFFALQSNFTNFLI